MPKSLTAAAEIDAWCTRCRMDLGHRIVAMVERAPKRVVCLTCGSEHNYRSPKTEDKKSKAVRPGKLASASKASPAKARTSKALAVEEAKVEWQRRTESGRPYRQYTIMQTFSEGDLVSHKKFGRGYVSALLPDSKVLITFSDGPKTLVHGHAG